MGLADTACTTRHTLLPPTAATRVAQNATRAGGGVADVRLACLGLGVRGEQCLADTPPPEAPFERRGNSASRRRAANGGGHI